MHAVRRWTPGPGFTTVIPGHSWWRADGDRHIVAVALAWPKTQPAWDGGQWTEPEIWTVRYPLEGDETIEPATGDDYGNGVQRFLGDKPHRITWYGEDAREVLSRVPVGRAQGVRLTDDLGLVWYASARDRRAWRLRGHRLRARYARRLAWRRREVREFRHWQRERGRDA